MVGMGKGAGNRYGIGGNSNSSNNQSNKNNNAKCNGTAAIILLTAGAILMDW